MPAGCRGYSWSKVDRIFTIPWGCALTLSFAHYMVQIYETLSCSGTEVEEAELNWVLNKWN